LTPHGQKLGVSGHHGRQWINATAGGSGDFPQRGLESELKELKAFCCTSS